MENYFQTNEWLQQRCGRFTASEIFNLFVESKTKGQVFGKSAMTYIRTKAAEILTQEVKEEVNFRQGEYGKATEPEACAAFESVMKLSGTLYGAGNPKFFPHGEFEGCSPDWETENVGADFKCPYNSAEHLLNLFLTSAADLEKERWEYYCQLQDSMLIRNWKIAFFVSYDPRMAYPAQRLKIIPVYPDQKWIAEFEIKIKLAIEELKTMLDRVMTVDFALATYDQEVKAELFEPLNILKRL